MTAKDVDAFLVLDGLLSKESAAARQGAISDMNRAINRRTEC
jgi:hypothetical protein